MVRFVIALCLVWFFAAGAMAAGNAMEEQRAAAEAGDLAAQVALGDAYMNGVGVEVAYDQALYYYRLAAFQGHPDAIYNMGSIYAYALGVKQDYVVAHMWFDLLARMGDADGIKLLAELERVMKPKNIEKAREMAAAWCAEHPGTAAC